MNDSGLQSKHAHIWRTLYSPLSSLYLTNPGKRFYGGIAPEDFLPSNSNRIMFSIIADIQIGLMFEFMQNQNIIETLTASKMFTFKVDDYGPIVQQSIKIFSVAVAEVYWIETILAK